MSDIYGYALRYTIDEFNWNKLHLVCHSMGTFVGTQYACIYPDHIDSLTLLDYGGIQLFSPTIVPMYARMSLESRFDRWKYDQKNAKSVPKTKEEFKHALQHGKEPQISWFKEDYVAEKWLEGGIREVSPGKYLSNNSPFNKMWGQTQWRFTKDENLGIEMLLTQ